MLRLVAQVLTRVSAACNRGSATAGGRSCISGDGADAGRIRNYQSQVAHGEVACAEIADERKPVSVLEAANRDHVAREPTGHVIQDVGYQPYFSGPGVNNGAGSGRKSCSAGKCFTVPAQSTTSTLR